MATSSRQAQCRNSLRWQGLLLTYQHGLSYNNDLSTTMGTLTAGQPRLAGYCDHKLPSSCRLTSIPECCACADERAHSAAYSTYIDGVGFVQRGNRWQRYCWFCKEFWENRVQASGLRPGQTRIPEVPDQTQFLTRWYEFHKGYRTVTKEDGSEERIAVLGEDFRDVSPGYLPRTLEELRAGRAANDMAEQSQQQQIATEEQGESGPSLEDTLDQLFASASIEDDERPQRIPGRTVMDSGSGVTHTPRTARELEFHRMLDDNDRQIVGGNEMQQARRSNTHAQAITPAGSRNRDYQARRIAALRRELHRMRNGIERVISGLRDLGENVPDHSEATGRLTDLGHTLNAIDVTPSREDAERAINSVNSLTGQTDASQSDRTLANIQARVDEARQHVNEARRNREQAASELDLADQESRTSQQRLQQLQREQRTTENYLRLFGTREEMLAQGEQYESPIGGMFNRAYERFRAAEEVRREERTLRRVLDDETTAGGEDEVRRLAELESRQRDIWGVPRPSQQAAHGAQQTRNEEELTQEPRGELEEYYALLRRQGWNQQASQLNEPEQQVATSGTTNTNISPVPTQEFPRSMLNAIIPARERELAEQTSGEVAELPASEPAVPVARLGERCRLDIEHITLQLAQNEELAMSLAIRPDDLTTMLSRMTESGPTEADQPILAQLLVTPEIVWSTGLPAAWLLRARRRGMHPVFADGFTGVDEFVTRAHNTELMIEAFQMSSQVRRRAPGLTAPEQLRVLYRLQAGERRMSDVTILESMLEDPQTLELARRAHNQANVGGAVDVDYARYSALEQQRRTAAREGDHSRRELDAQRRATQAFAVAAGRTAMRTGPTALIQQMADRDEQTQAAYERLRQNGYAPDGNTPAERLLRETLYRPLHLSDYGDLDSPSESASEEEDEEQGLDAKDSGRPQPKTDEEMTISMECRICYTQLAEIACLPCGHLVMCKWCSEQHSPAMAHDKTRPRRAAGCPVCRKAIRQKVRVFRA